MSRIGKKPITIPAGVTVNVEGAHVVVRGPKGERTRLFHKEVSVRVIDRYVVVAVANEADQHQRALWGTSAAHIQNMIQGVAVGFQKQLEVNGVGYRVALQGTDIKLEVGFSHPVIYHLPKEVQATVEKNVITFKSADVERLGLTAAAVRAIRPPEPYKGKGIKYLDEVIRRKAGKAAKATSA